MSVALATLSALPFRDAGDAARACTWSGRWADSGMGHEHNDARSLEYHRVVASRLTDDPALLQAARTKLRSWRDDSSVHEYYIDGWERLLAMPVPQLISALIDPAQEANDLRQVSPFSAALDPRERWALWRSTRAAVQEP